MIYRKIYNFKVGDRTQSGPASELNKPPKRTRWAVLSTTTTTAFRAYGITVLLRMKEIVITTDLVKSTGQQFLAVESLHFVANISFRGDLMLSRFITVNVLSEYHKTMANFSVIFMLLMFVNKCGEVNVRHSSSKFKC